MVVADFVVPKSYRSVDVEGWIIARHASAQKLSSHKFFVVTEMSVEAYFVACYVFHVGLQHFVFERYHFRGIYFAEFSAHSV